MTALSTSRDTVQMGSAALPQSLSVPLSVAKVHQGSIVVINSAGYGAPASVALGLVAVGRAEETVDNTAGSAGDKYVAVTRGAFKFANSASTDAITQADVGRLAYLVDDQTVARTDGTCARSVAGKILQVDTDGVWVELGVISDDPRVTDVMLVAAADLSAKQYYFVTMTNAAKAALASSAGADCIGVLQNAPVADAIAIVRVSGPSQVIASGVIAIAARLATDAAGKSKAAVAASTNTSDAGAASDPLIGSHVMGIALTAGAADTAHRMLVQPLGAIPSTAA